MKPTFYNTTLVLACYQSGQILSQTLYKNLKAGFKKIVLIDGESTDNTQEIIRDLNQKFPGRIEFYQYPKLGLANARNKGTSKVKSIYTMHGGPDNIIPKETLKKLTDLNWKYDLISCQTETISRESTYLERAHKIYKKRFQAGSQTVVGTPYLGKTSLFRDFPFNEDMLNSDDTELCDRLTRRGKTIYRSTAVCLETGFNDLPNIIERWMRWGRGDALFYKAKNKEWNLLRKIESWCHPFKAELMDTWCALTFSEGIFCLPFLLFTLTLRYLGWLRYLVFKK